MRKYNYWTCRELKVLRENYGKMYASEIAELLPRHNIGSIWNKASALGLTAMRGQAEPKRKGGQDGTV